MERFSQKKSSLRAVRSTIAQRCRKVEFQGNSRNLSFESAFISSLISLPSATSFYAANMYRKIYTFWFTHWCLSVLYAVVEDWSKHIRLSRELIRNVNRSHGEVWHPYKMAFKYVSKVSSSLDWINTAFRLLSKEDCKQKVQLWSRVLISFAPCPATKKLCGIRTLKMFGFCFLKGF